MPKRIAIFCDGTWNRPDAPFPTNVYKLFHATLPEAPDGTTQLRKYIPGVGTGFGLKGLARQYDRIVGGAFGVGVTANILTAYRFIAEHYQPGDTLFIFGFSRGAFTARSLAGMLRASGLPQSDATHRVFEALSRYRSRWDYTKPDTLSSWTFRRSYSSAWATSTAEADWREAQGDARPPLLSVTYLGVWDTVGALGVPGHYKLLARLLNTHHEFHDTQLSRSVKSARHAVAIDERRATYPPAPWENLGDLNADDPENTRRYRQAWFPGDHGSVGGGGDITGLSNITLRWVAKGAMDQGMAFDPELMAGYAADEDLTAPLMNQSDPPDGIFARALRWREMDRDGPKTIWRISGTARDRWCALPVYRPTPLARFADELTAQCDDR